MFKTSVSIFAGTIKEGTHFFNSARKCSSFQDTVNNALLDPFPQRLEITRAEENQALPPAPAPNFGGLVITPPSCPSHGPVRSTPVFRPNPYPTEHARKLRTSRLRLLFGYRGDTDGH